MTITEPINADPNDPAWIEARRTFIGASDAPAVLGISPWATPLDVWADKLNLGQRFTGNLATDMGHALEDMIRQQLAAHLGRAVMADGTTVRHPDHPHIAASVDGWVSGAPLDLAELKYVGPTTAYQWRDGVPVYVQAQCQVQMAVTGAQRCHVAALIVDYAPTFFTQTIERNDAVIAEIIDRLNTFWTENVEAQQRPELDLSWNAGKVSDALARIYSEPEPNSAVRLGGWAGELIAQRKHTKALVKDLETQLDQIDNELKAALGDATEGFVDDNAKPAVTWRPQTRSRWDVAAVLARKGEALDGFLEVELDIAERVLRAVETTATIRVLRVA